MSRHHRNIPGGTRAWEKVRYQAFERDGHRCVDCNRLGPLEGHHLVPLEQGGAALDVDNVVSLCALCHIARHRTVGDPEWEEWDTFAAEAP